MANKYTLPTDSDVDEASIDGYTDGFINKDKAANKYIGRDVLYSAYIKAKSEGATDRMKVKNRRIKNVFSNESED